MMRAAVTSLLFMLGSPFGSAQAENLGEKGQTYVLDQDARETIKDALRTKEHSGETARFWNAYRDQTINAIKNPAPLPIASSYARKVELKTLAYTFPADVRDQKGRVLVQRGTLIEPLKIQPLKSGLIFIDGRDQRQVDYAISRGRKQPIKIVLTAGSPYALRLKYQNETWWGGTKTIPFYFDQRMMILNALSSLYGVNVKSVPALLTQQGAELAVEYGLGAQR